VKPGQRDICLSEFRRFLKTFLFCWDSAPCDFLFKCAVYKYTYLLTYLLRYNGCAPYLATVAVARGTGVGAVSREGIGRSSFALSGTWRIWRQHWLPEKQNWSVSGAGSPPESLKHLPFIRILDTPLAKVSLWLHLSSTQWRKQRGLRGSKAHWR